MEMKASVGIIVILILISIWWWSSHQVKWTGFYYPEEGNTFNYSKSPEFKSVDECRNWVYGMESKYNPSGSGYDYECGKNCKLSDSGVDIYHCDETVE